MLTGSSDEDTLLANISAIVMMMAPASPLDMYVNLSLRLVSNVRCNKSNKTDKSGYTYN